LTNKEIEELSIEDVYEETEITELNKKRVQNKKDWIKILEAEEERESNDIFSIFEYLYTCKNYMSNGKRIEEKLNMSINGKIRGFGLRVIKLLGIDEQDRKDGRGKRYWNIPFETVESFNKEFFTWRLRKELVEALEEKYNLQKETENLDDKIENFMKDCPYDDYMNSIKDNLDTREKFVTNFTVSRIVQMEIDDFVIGKSKIDDKGKESFCYLIETQMRDLGEMRGAFVDKFGVWFAPKTNEYEFTKKFGNNIKDAFYKLKEEICSLIIAGNNDDFEAIENSMISPLFRGKILATYYPEKFLCIFKEEDVDKFLYELDIKYDMHEFNTLEKKKKLLLEYKNLNKYFNQKSNYYFVSFLYTTFKNELKIKHTVNGEIDYNIEFIDFNYLGKHEVKKKSTFRPRETDYERISRNKKDVGNRGENAILNNEIDKLRKLGLNYLADKVSLCENDAEGYDLVSYDSEGNEIHIEVKTNSSNSKYLDFYITDNELQHLMSDDKYYIYYLYDIKNSKPKCHIINKQEILKNREKYLRPVIYKVDIDVEKK